MRPLRQNGEALGKQVLATSISGNMLPRFVNVLLKLKIGCKLLGLVEPQRDLKVCLAFARLSCFGLFWRSH